jgi:hypothetical protein
MQGYPVQNGVVAACRFWDIAQGIANGGEVILMEHSRGHADTMSNNAFVYCHAYGCSGPGVQLAGSGVHHNYFHYLTLHVMNGAIVLDGYKDPDAPEDNTLIYENEFLNIEMSANLSCAGHLSNNSFTQIVQLQVPLRQGNEVPAALAYYGYAPNNTPPTFQGVLPFSDSSYHVGAEPANTYANLFVSGPNGLLYVFVFPNIGTTAFTPPP